MSGRVAAVFALLAAACGPDVADEICERRVACSLVPAEEVEGCATLVDAFLVDERLAACNACQQASGCQALADGGCASECDYREPEAG